MENKTEPVKNSQSAHTVIAIVFSVLFAFILWFYIQGEESPDYSAKFTSVEVTCRGLPEGLSIISRSDTTCDITLTGKRSDLSKIKSANIESYIDLGNITSSGVYDMDLTVMSPENAVVSEIFPQKVQVMIDITLSKSVPVVIEKGEYTTKADTVLEIVPVETAITVIGPKTIIDTVSSARVFTGALGEVDSSFERSIAYTLIDTAGNSLQTPYIYSGQKSVTVDFNVTKTKTVPTRLDFEHNYWGNDVSYTISPQNVTIKGEPNFVDTITSIAVAKIDETLVNSNRIFQKISPENFLLPDGITLTGKISEAQADITVTNNISKTIQVPVNLNSAHFHITGLAEGFTPVFTAHNINLIVRGNPTEITAASISDFHLYVDLSTLDGDGTQTCEVKVVQTETTKGKYYAVGTYSVKVRLEKTAAE